LFHCKKLFYGLYFSNGKGKRRYYIMKILFCSEGFLIDGVASFNLYLSSALSKAGHEVAIAGRWAGFKSFRERHINNGVQIIEDISVVPDSRRLVGRSLAFKPDIILTDSRRAFPLAMKVKKRSGARLVTIFHDIIWDKPQKKNREIETILRFSDAVVTSEDHILEQIKALNPSCPAKLIRRPVTDMVKVSPFPAKDPFKVLCLGRLSGYKSPGFRDLLENAVNLKQSIPSLEMTFVGGGDRTPIYKFMANKVNRRVGQKFVNITGTLTDPNPFFKWSTIVCAGATSAIEGLLSNRPVIAFSGFWMGTVTSEKLQSGIDTHFGERSGDLLMRENPGRSSEEVLRLYKKWEELDLEAQTELMRTRLEKIFSSSLVASSFEELFMSLDS